MNGTNRVARGATGATGLVGATQTIDARNSQYLTDPISRTNTMKPMKTQIRNAHD